MQSIFLVESGGLNPVHADAETAEGYRKLLSLLSFEGRRMVDRVERAIRLAISKREPTVLVCGSDGSEFGMLISIRAAREPGRAIVTVNNLDKLEHALQWPMLMEMFGVTRAEAEIAIALFEGEDLEAIAQRRQVSLETVRGQVKSLLRKFGVHNQRRLASMLSSVALTLPGLAASPIWGITASAA